MSTSRLSWLTIVPALFLAVDLQAQTISRVDGEVTDLFGTAIKMISWRFQERMWVTSDGGKHLIVNQGNIGISRGLALYSSYDQGRLWSLKYEFFGSNSSSTADGVMLSDFALNVVHTDARKNVLFRQLAYDRQSQTWEPVRVTLAARSTTTMRAEMPSLGIDSVGQYWVSYTELPNDPVADRQIRILSSADTGGTWSDTGVRLGWSNEFRKASKLVPLSDRMGIVYSDFRESSAGFHLRRNWADRLNLAPRNAGWSTELVHEENPVDLETMEERDVAHFSVISDPLDNVHLVPRTEAPDVLYLRRDGGTRVWESNVIMQTPLAVYTQVSRTFDNRIYVALNLTEGPLIGLMESTDDGHSFAKKAVLIPVFASGVVYDRPRIETPSLILDNRLTLLQQVEVTQGTFGLITYDVNLSQFSDPRQVDADVAAAISVFPGDFDGDGDMDLVSASLWVNESLQWHENVNGDGSLWMTHSVTEQINSPHSVSAADMDGDGDMDVVSASIGDDRFAWFENSRGDGSVWIPHDITLSADHANDVYTVDIDNDGDVDVVGAWREADTISWFENAAGDGSLWITHIVDNSAATANSVSATDIDGDGDTDIIATARDDDEVVWHENVGGGGLMWVKHLISGALKLPLAANFADIDGDGDMDPVVCSLPDDVIVWFENEANGTSWTMRTIVSATDGPHGISPGDLDGDGDIDLLGASFYSDEVFWYENMNGDGTNWKAHLMNDAADGAADVFAVDLDADNDLDAVSVSLLGSSAHWYLNTTPVE